MALRPGHLYRVGARLYADSQALHSLANRHEVLPTAAGYRILADPPVACTLVEGRPALPSQHGNVYELSAPAVAPLVRACSAWIAAGALASGGSFDTWPGEHVRACSTCGPACGCGPCRLRHHHDHHHDPKEHP